MKKQVEKKIEMTPEIMDKIHQCGQEILDAFVQICKENNLRYYLIAGTLLGAVRHKGPIPWDDDIDVCMPRADMERFKEIMLARPEGETYHIHCFENDHNYAAFTIKLKKRGTVYESQGLIDRGLNHLELWLDIFPLDEAPGKISIKYRILGARIALMKRLISNKTFVNTERQSMKCKLMHLFLNKFSIYRLRTHAEKLMDKYNNKQCSNYVSWASHYNFLKQTMPKNWYEPATKVMYNRKHYCAPCKWDKILTKLYGDYMKPPAIINKSGHGATKIEI